ncbi:MAG: hypothetical protein M1832_003036 [Thelocarpon impressellum]|nr:MAG: hypothetical protein M1832_003036 [Thelocarpon impressellum]
MSQTSTSSQRVPSFKIFTPEKADALRHAGILSEAVGGVRILSTGSLGSFASASSSDTVEIPDYLDSAVTVKFLGFTESAANEIYARFVRAGQNMQCLEPSLLDMAKATINMNTSENMDDWDREMQDMGIGYQLRAAMVAPGHDMVRSTASLGEWLVITIAERMDFLEALDTIILVHQPAPPPPGVPGSSMDPPDRIRTPPGPASRARRPQMSHFAPPKGSETAADTEKKDSETVRPGDLHFLKGGRYSWLERIRDAEPRLMVSEALCLVPTDFTGMTRGVYLTSQWQTAWQYADWARERHPVEGGGILHFSVPQELLVGRQEINGHAWQRLVWYSRRGQLLPDDIVEWDDVRIIDGPICGISTPKMRRLATKGHDETCVEVMRLRDGNRAFQNFFRFRTRLEHELFGLRVQVWLDRIRER